MARTATAAAPGLCPRPYGCAMAPAPSLPALPGHRGFRRASIVRATSRQSRRGGPARISTAPVDHATPPPPPEFDFRGEIARLASLRSLLAGAPTLREKLRVVRSEPRVVRFLDGGAGKVLSSLGLDPSEMWLLECLVAAGQEHVLRMEFGGEQRRSGLKSAMFMLVGFVEQWEGGGGRDVSEEVKASVKELVMILGEIEKFYDCVGGIIGCVTPSLAFTLNYVVSIIIRL